jgi:pyruvate-formate lyase-activating enzyme
MRKKLRLQIEKLCVEQFETHPDAPETVQSFMTEYHSCGGVTIAWGEPCICLDMPSSIC